MFVNWNCGCVRIHTSFNCYFRGTVLIKKKTEKLFGCYRTQFGIEFNFISFVCNDQNIKGAPVSWLNNKTLAIQAFAYATIKIQP